MADESFGPEFEVYGDRWHLFCQDARFEIDYPSDQSFSVTTSEHYRVTWNLNFGLWIQLASPTEVIEMIRNPEILALSLNDHCECTRHGRTRRIVDRNTYLELTEVQNGVEVPLARVREAWRDSEKGKRIAYFISASTEIEPIEYALIIVFDIIKFLKPRPMNRYFEGPLK
jgi:hypothetical protein